jgi:hypothetical protein
MGVGGWRHTPAAFTPGKDPVPILQEVGWAPGPVWIGVENLTPTGIWSLDIPACSELLYWLRCPRPPEAAFIMSTKYIELCFALLGYTDRDCSMIFLRDKTNRKVCLKEDGAWLECFQPKRLLVQITKVFSLCHKANLCSNGTHPSNQITAP